MNPKLKIIRVPAVKVMLNKLDCTLMVSNQRITPLTKIASEREPIRKMQQQKQQQLAIAQSSSLTLEVLRFAYLRQT